jgi:hypothetical protein
MSDFRFDPGAVERLEQEISAKMQNTAQGAVAGVRCPHDEPVTIVGPNNPLERQLGFGIAAHCPEGMDAAWSKVEDALTAIGVRWNG